MEWASEERLASSGTVRDALDRDLLLDVFEALHEEQGKRIMDHWNMPKVYYSVVSNHHDPNFDTNDTVLTVVRLVNAACKYKGIGLTHQPDLDLLELPEAAILQLSQEDVDDLYDLLEDSQEIAL